MPPRKKRRTVTMVEFPSFGGWISKQPLIFQLNFNMFMKMAPIFVFAFGQSICKGLGYSAEFSLAIPGMAGAAFFILFMYWDFGNRNQSTAFLPLNGTFVWSPTRADELITNIIEYVPLKEMPGEGQYIYGVKFDRPIKDDKKEDFQHAIFITQHPMDKAFRRIPGQWIAYGGSVFEGMGARIVCTYANEYTDLQGYSEEEMNMASWKIFHVKWCLEDSKKDQIHLGLYKENTNTIERDTVKEAMQLEIDRKATRLAASLRESKGQLSVYGEAYKDTRTKSYQSVNRLIDDIDRIKQERVGTITRMLRDPKVRIILAIATIAITAYVLKYYKVV